MFFLKREGKKNGKREAAAGRWTVVLHGIVAGGAVMAVLLGVCAVLITGTVVPQRYAWICVLITCVAAAGISGRVVVCGTGGKRILWGIGMGLLLSAFLGMAGFFLYGMVDVQRALPVGAACLCGGGMSGVLTRRYKKRKNESYTKSNR